MDLNKNPNKWIYDIEDVEEGLSDYWRDIFDEIPEDKTINDIALDETIEDSSMWSKVKGFFDFNKKTE